MSDGYIVWLRANGVLELQKHADRPRSDSEYYRSKMVGDPIRLRPGEWDLTIDELRKRYEAPPMAD